MKLAGISPANRAALWLAGTWFCLVLLGPVVAAEKPEPSTAATNTVTGRWTYSLDVSIDTSLDFTAEFKQDGGTVTGTVTVQELKTAIEKGRFKDGRLTFEIPREYAGVKFTSRYSGRLAGDTLKGKILSGTAPLERTYEWNARRVKSAP